MRIVLAVMLSLAAPVGAAELVVCSAPTAAEQDAGRTLAGWVRGARVRVDAACSGALTGRFEGTGAVRFRLTSKGKSLSRRVPWLDSAEAPLSTLNAKGRLRAFAVLADSLILEARMAPPPPPPRPRKPRPKPVAKAPPLPPPPPAPPPEPILWHSTESPAGLDSTVAVSPRRPPARPTRWHLGVDGGVRFRSPGLLAPEIGLEGGFGGGFAQLGWQPNATWQLDGREIESTALAARVGWRFGFEFGDLRVSVPVFVAVEALSAQRLDVDDDQTWYPDLALGTGVELDLGVVGLSRAGLLVHLQGSPTAREIEVEAGPARRFNRVSGLAALRILVGP